jgi:hypothetical protein
MARALYNKLNKYNLGGLVKRYDHGGEHADDGSPIFDTNKKIDAPGDTGTNIYTTQRNNPNRFAEGEKEANEASKNALVSDIRNIQTDEFKNKAKQLLQSREISRQQYDLIVGKDESGNNPLKTMSTMADLGLINLEDYSSFNDRVNFFTAGWGDQTRADFVKGISSGVIEEVGSTRGRQVSEDSFIQNMYKGGDPSRGFRGSLTNKDGELGVKTKRGSGGDQLKGRLVDANVVNFDPSESYTYTEGVKDEEVIQDEKIVEDETPVVEDDQTVVEEKVDVDEIPVKDPLKTPIVVKKDIVPVKEDGSVKDEGEVVEDEIPVLTGNQPGPPPPMKFNIQGRSDRTGTGGPGGSSDVPTQADTGLYGITGPRQNFRLIKEDETRENGGKLYRHGGLAMLARRSRQAAMGRKYNQGGRMTNQELGRLLAKYNVR